MTYGRPTANSTSRSLTRQTGTLGGQPRTEAHEGPDRLRREPPLLPGPRERSRPGQQRRGAGLGPQDKEGDRQHGERRHDVGVGRARPRVSGRGCVRPRRPPLRCCRLGADRGDRARTANRVHAAEAEGTMDGDPELKAGDAVNVLRRRLPRSTASTSSPRRATSSTRTATGRTSSSAAVRTAP